MIGIARSFPSPLPPSFIPHIIDLEKTKELPKAFLELSKTYPHVDAIVCNAGKGRFGSLEELSFDDIHSLLHLNFLSSAYLIKAFLPALKQKNKGDILFIGSEASLQGKKQGSAYCASKFALRGFAQALREECATNQIRVSLINPGMVQTDFFTNTHFSPGEEFCEHILPEDVAEAAFFLLEIRQGTVVDEINLSPQKKKIVFKGKRP